MRSRLLASSAPISILGTWPLMLLLSGCTPRVYSPPSRPFPLQSTAGVGAGKVGLGMETAIQGALFGPDVGSSALRVRYGLNEELELDGELALAQVLHENKAADQSSAIFGTRIGAKYTPEALDRIVALVCGVGGGASTAGGFLATDLGLILAWENRHLVPFLSFQGLLSAPVAAEEVDVSHSEDPAGTHMDTPSLTWGFRLQLGLKVPLGPGAFYLGLGWTRLDDADGPAETFTGLGLGVELAF